MRIFLAIYPPEDWRRYIRDALRAMDKEKRNLRPVNIDQVHLTVKFFGRNLNHHARDVVADALLDAQGTFQKPKIEMLNLQLGLFKQHSPSILLLNIADDPDLLTLTNQIHHLTRDLKLRDVIRWKPKDSREHHMSIARLKPAAITNSTIRRVRDLVKAIDIPLPEPFIPDEMQLVQSVVTATGPQYQNLEKIRL
jgi:2'-5' RNA ligase